LDPQDSVTSVIQQRPKPTAVAEYEAWLKEITPAAQRFPGHRGVNVIRPHDASGAYTIVLHFDTLEHLTAWLESDTRARLVEKVRPLLVTSERIEIKTGLEFWFTPPPGHRQAKPYKQFLVTFSAIFPLTIVVPWVLQPVFARLPLLGQLIVSNFIVVAIIVGLMTYVIMPRYTRLIANWLYR
jgi:antibiotic biosynthesis monooxygenase (ABM) superfamily enzyme